MPLSRICRYFPVRRSCPILYTLLIFLKSSQCFLKLKNIYATRFKSWSGGPVPPGLTQPFITYMYKSCCCYCYFYRYRYCYCLYCYDYLFLYYYCCCCCCCCCSVVVVLLLSSAISLGGECVETFRIPSNWNGNSC